MKKLLLSVLVPLSLGAMEGALTQINPSNVLVHHELGNAQLFHSKQGFHVQTHEGTLQPIAHYNMDKPIRKLTSEQLQAFQRVGFFTLKKLSNGEIALSPHVRGEGGGAGGAAVGAWVGKFVGYSIGVAGLAAINAISGPVVVITGPAAAMTAAAAIEAFSNKCAIAGGIIGAIATGPA